MPLSKDDHHAGTVSHDRAIHGDAAIYPVAVPVRSDVDLDHVAARKLDAHLR